MKTLRYPKLRALPLIALGALLTGNIAFAQTGFPIDPHDSRAYQPPGEVNKSAATPGRLLSTVNYITRQDTLSGYDSSRITYSATGDRITELRHFRWDAGTWRPYDRFSYAFNSSGLNDQTIYEFYDPLRSSFFPVARYNYSHNAGGSRSELFYEVFSAVTSVYRNGLMERYTYNAAGLPATMQQQVWNVNTGAWDNSNMETFLYNPQGNRTSYTIQSWNFTPGAWENKRQTLTSYDASGLLQTRAEDYTWASATIGWRNKSRTTNAIAGGKISEQLAENFDPVTSSWVKYTRETMSYLGTGSLGTSVRAAWSPASGNFAEQSRASYTYNTDNQLKRVQTLVRVHGTWVVATGAGEVIHYYEGEKQPQLNVAHHTGTYASFGLTPIPAQQVLNVHYAPASTESCRLSILDMSGRAVSVRTAEFSGPASSIALDLCHLPAGTYSFSMDRPDGERLSRLFTISK